MSRLQFGGFEMGIDPAIERYRQVQSIRRAYYAADGRRDHHECAKLENHLMLAEDLERVTPPTSDQGARGKLKIAAWYAEVSAGSENGVDEDVAREIEGIWCKSGGGCLTLKDLIALRALLPRAVHDSYVYDPLRFAVDWLSRPKIAASAG
jgi:hypothetical protein